MFAADSLSPSQAGNHPSGSGALSALAGCRRESNGAGEPNIN
jgi:hypothetical protein